jgi:hypothetical protein
MTLTFVEQPVFTKVITNLLSDDDYRAFQNELAQAPARWPVVPGSGGLHKARMRLPGRGKRGGARVLYLYFPLRQTVFFYLVYEKGEIEDVPKGKMKEIRDEVQRIKKHYETQA